VFASFAVRIRLKNMVCRFVAALSVMMITAYAMTVETVLFTVQMGLLAVDVPTNNILAFCVIFESY